MKSKAELKEKFSQLNLTRVNQTLRLSSQLSQLAGFMQHTIKKDFDNNPFAFTICAGGSRTFKVSTELEAVLKNCNLGQKVDYYQIFVNFVADVETDMKTQQQYLQLEELTVKIMKGLKIKEPVKIKVQKLVLDCKNYQIDLNTYLLRKSKKEGSIYLLQTLIQQQPPTIRFQILEASPLKINILMHIRRRCFKKYLSQLNENQENQVNPKEIKLSKKVKPVRTMLLQEQFNVKEAEEKLQNQLKQNAYNQHIKNKSIVEELIENIPGSCNEQIYQFLERREEEVDHQQKSRAGKLHKNQLSILLPHFNIQNLQIYHDFVIYEKNESKKMFIYFSQKYNSYKLQLTMNTDCQRLVRQLCEGQNQKLWNRSINESQVKWAITSENTTIFYRKQKSLSQWYRQRDFIFIKYLFKKDNCFYIIDRSIQDTYFIPFQSIHRGHIKHSICRLQPLTNHTSKLILELSIQYGGMLTQQQKKELSLSYLRQYMNLQSFLQNFNSKTKNMYDFTWEIESTPYNASSNSFASINSDIFQIGTQELEDIQQESFYSIPDELERVEITIEEKMRNKVAEVREYINEEIRLTEEGFAILPNLYLRVRHPNAPIKVNESRKKVSYDNIMLKNDFVIDKEGGMLLVNQERIAAQNNVLKFIMATLKKNLFSGKGILNISLPVEIFNIDSNLQRLCESLALAPQLLEKKAVSATPLQRFKNCIAFALSNSILYFDIDKAFNPILGQTFQGLINGCPVYGEQISHHPPISSILFYGRGYKVYANIQAKVYIHLNSGEGINEGLYTIQFDDGGKVVFQTAPGEISGLAVGDRKYKIKGKMIVLDPSNKFCSSINFQEESGLFASRKWIYSDQMQGEIVQVTDSYIRNFFGTQPGKEFKAPGKKQIQQTLGKIQGRWIQKLVIDGKTIYDIKQLPYEMIHYQFPLNSNSDYREDLIYRKMNNLARSQQEKERLEVLQRNDRKFRQKYHPIKH